MRYIVTCGSDVGGSRSVNQDAVAIKHISTYNEEVVFTIMCDGMGGLKHGEIASASVVRIFMKWFDEKFLKKLSEYNKDKIFEDWREVINRINDKLYRYGKNNKISIGTTVTVMLINNTDYYILNIGDCRAYELNSDIRQLTNDHSVVAKEIQKGNLTEEEARFDKRRNQLIKSVGVLKEVKPDFFCGKIESGGVYMLCCDGVRNKVYDDELLYYFHPAIMTSISNMENNIEYIFSLNKQRKETDNMSVILIKDNATTIVLQNEENQVVVEREKIMINTDEFIDVEMEGEL